MDIYLVFASYRVLASISAEQVPMQCSSPMQFITTYVGFNYCRSFFMQCVLHRADVQWTADYKNKVGCALI